MLLETLVDERTVADQLPLQGLQQLDVGDRQRALGEDRGFRAAKLIGPGKNLHALSVPFWMKQLLRVQEVLPFAFSGPHQVFGRGEPRDEGPGRRRAPILECFQRGGIILVERLLKLVDQCRALFNQRHFIPAQQPQLLHQRFRRGQNAPAFPLQTQRIGQRPAIGAVGFRAAGQPAQAVRFGAARMHWINAIIQHDQPFNGRAVPGFNRNGQLWKLRQPLLAECPTGRGVIEPEFGDDFPSTIQHEHVVMVLGPIEPGEVRDLIPSFHCLRFLSFGCGSAGRNDPVHSRPNTVALAGRSSLRLLNTSRQRRRFS